MLAEDFLVAYFVSIEQTIYKKHVDLDGTTNSTELDSTNARTKAGDLQLKKKSPYGNK